MVSAPAWSVTSPEGQTSNGTTGTGGTRPLYLAQGMVAARGRQEDGSHRGRGQSVSGIRDLPSERGRARSASATPSMRGRRESVDMGGRSRDVSADRRSVFREDPMFDANEYGEGQGMLGGDGNGNGKLKGKEFEDGFHGVETGYGGR